MRNPWYLGAALALMAGAAMAAKPTSITYVKEVPQNGEVYAHFKVKCSDGSEKDVSAWDNRKLWCQGLGGKDECDKKQIASAKRACK